MPRSRVYVPRGVEGVIERRYMGCFNAESPPSRIRWPEKGGV